MFIVSSTQRFKELYFIYFIVIGIVLEIKVTFAPNLAKKLSSIFYYIILLFQLSVANPENFKEFKAREVLKIRKEKTEILPTSLVRYRNGGKNKSRQVCTLYQNSISYAHTQHGPCHVFTVFLKFEVPFLLKFVIQNLLFQKMAQVKRRIRNARF